MSLYRGSRRITRPIVNGQLARMLVRRGRQVWPCRRAAPMHGVVSYRITEEDGPDGLEKWFEVGFIAPGLLAGSAGAGWVDATGWLRIWLEHSEDLVTWSDDPLIDCPGSPSETEDGWEYWARSPWPVDSMVKSGILFCESDARTGDPRNNPFTSITIADEVQDLPNFPYSMPDDAAQLQADLRAAGWTGATVAATSDILWRVEIPGVTYESYSTMSLIGWPGYLVPNVYGELVNLVAFWSFSGAFVNGSEVRTAVPKQFARLGIAAV